MDSTFTKCILKGIVHIFLTQTHLGLQLELTLITSELPVIINKVLASFLIIGTCMCSGQILKTMSSIEQNSMEQQKKCLSIQILTS